MQIYIRSNKTSTYNIELYETVDFLQEKNYN